MMFYKVLKYKIFWIVWLTLSCIGGIIGYISIQNREKKLIEAKVAFVRDFRKDLRYPSTFAVECKSDTFEYVQCFKKELKTVNFRSMHIPDGTMVYILEVTPDGNLVKIAIKWNLNDRVHPPYGEYWIWHEFIDSSQ